MADFLMPKLSDTMEEGTVLRWLVDDGSAVEKGQELVEIETDKANMTVQAPEAGTLRVTAPEGEVRAVGEPIAEIGEGAPAGAGAGAEPAGEADAGAREETEAPGTEEARGGEEAEREEAERGEGPAAGVATEEMYPGAREEDGGAEEAAPAREQPKEPSIAPDEVGPAPEETPADRVPSSPLARRLAAERGVDIARVRGTGPGGRVVRADVEAAARGDEGARRAAPAGGGDRGASREPARPAPAREAPATEAPAPSPDGAGGERVPLTRLQRTVAQRMAQSAEAPQFPLERDVDATEAVALRRQLVEASEGSGPSLNDLIVRAVAMAAAERPDAVSRFDGDALVRPSGIHVGVAVSVDRGLLVPVVRDADRKSVGRIAEEVRDLAGRCRDGSITPPELEGSVVSVSNLGMFGIDRFAAIINPPETAILAVGRAAPRPVVRDDEVVVRDVMTLTLSVDHRALYGAEGAVFLGRVAELIERPGGLVL